MTTSSLPEPVRVGWVTFTPVTAPNNPSKPTAFELWAKLGIEEARGSDVYSEANKLSETVNTASGVFDLAPDVTDTAIKPYRAESLKLVAEDGGSERSFALADVAKAGGGVEVKRDASSPLRLVAIVDRGKMMAMLPNDRGGVVVNLPGGSAPQAKLPGA